MPTFRPLPPSRRAVLTGCTLLGFGVLTLQHSWPNSWPAPAVQRIAMAEMTWVEVRQALDQGYTTALVPSGGLEQNGPYLAIAKHDSIVAWTARRIAEGLGHTLIAPVVSYVPQGDFDPPTGNLVLPGTLGVSEEAYAGTLEGIARSLKGQGFRTILFIADHGGSLAPQQRVAARLDRDWAPQGVRVLSVDDYYVAGNRAQTLWLEAQGETAATIGGHAGLADHASLMATAPERVDFDRAPPPLLARLGLAGDGSSGDPRRATAERGRALLALQVEAALAQIRRFMTPKS
ncbi:creatininase family protein [Methylobacterium sp. 17Sr1-1]|uniref:creatininase family protein n=1 Tax=Methylobacterium sp. 17Sr1-1 TaxID=2202826 RepID=UPI000D6F7A9E|nr:creatininase family protein [Methylobacterium sp. 17Sr1-1]AWN52322.1 creatininase [Methylobacterium sp. 17Sr1-1]